MSNALLNNRGIIIPYKSFIKKNGRNKCNKLFESLTIITKQKVGPNKIAKIYTEMIINEIRCLILPRFAYSQLLCDGYIDKINNKLSSGLDITKVSNIFLGKLYPNQIIIVDYIMKFIYTPENIKKGQAGLILQMRAGFGKTYVAAGIINKLRKRTLYIVPNSYLRDQTMEDMNNSFSSLINIGIFSNKIDISKQDITIIIINSAMKCDKKFFNTYGLVIFDEAHTYCSPQRSSIFWKCQSQFMLGLTATPYDRLDGFDLVSHMQLGEVIESEKIPGFKMDGISFEGNVNVINYQGPDEHTENLVNQTNGILSAPLMDDQFIRDPYRNKLIIKEAIKLCNMRGDEILRCGNTDDKKIKKMEIFIFSSRRDHLIRLKSLLESEIKSNNKNIHIYAPELSNTISEVNVMMGGSNKTEVDEAQKSQIILTTYGYSGTGVSIPKMNSIIFATPRRNGFKQIIARILRRSGDTTIIRKIIDIVDIRTALANQLSGRKIGYSLYNFNIKYDTVKYLDID